MAKKQNSIKTEKINIVVAKDLLKDIKNHSKDFNYNSYTEFIREAIREKLYGKNIKEQITNEFLKQIEEEKDYIFSEKKDLHNKLKLIAKKF